MGTSMTETGDDFEQMWRDLAPLGRSAASGGYFRQPFTSVEAELRAWFVEQCARARAERRGRRQRQPVAWWTPADPSATDATPVLIGSHLDSVLDGGAYDGPLGVVSALAAIDLLRERGVRAAPPDRGRRLRRGGGVPVRARLPRLAARHRRRPVPRRPRELRDRDGVPPARRDGRRRTRARPRPGRVARPDRLLRGAARRAGPRPGRPRRAGRAGHRDLAARALPLRLHRRRPTTPAPRGWRTAATRCSPTR